jgi:hypothetical protein
LALTAAELVREALGMRRRQADLAKQDSHVIGTLMPWPQAMDYWPVGDLGAYSPPWVEARIWILKDELHAWPQGAKLGAAGVPETKRHASSGRPQ